MSKPPSLLTLIAVLVALAIFGVVGARYMLGSHSASTLNQLSIVWPNVETMPPSERNFLVELALTCDLVSRQAIRSEVLDCLRSAAPKVRQDAPAQLERLVGTAAPAAHRP